ncbi:hypothetical protein GGE56_004430 [Rhizobium leguminosarum]|nr:hypothetical protein [Rhizobium leguminosarum]MBB6296119.1 hypothetical protein [Rhizobium leguminosarum]
MSTWTILRIGVGVYLEADLVTFSERTALLQSGHVNEHVRSTILWGNEAKSLITVEKFDSTGRHLSSSSVFAACSRAKRT